MIEKEQEIQNDIDMLDANQPDPLNGLAAIPGFALTLDKQKWKWDRPPLYANPNDAIDAVVDEFEKPYIKNTILKFILAGVSVEEVVETTVMNGFMEGKYTPDVAELIKPALTIKLLTMAQEENVPVRIFTDNMKDKEVSDEQVFRVMKRRNPETYKTISENINKAVRMGEQIEENEMKNVTPKPPQEGFLGVGE